MTSTLLRIPQIFHQTWKTSDIPDEWQACVQSWRSHHPHWQFILWTDASSRQFINDHYPEFLACYDGYSYNIQRADVIRYCVLHTYGGVYADLDMECLQPIEPLLAKHTFVVGYEPPLQTQDMQEASVIGNAFIASVPGHRLLSAVLRSLMTTDPRITVHREVLTTTGPLMLSRVVRDYPHDDIALLADHILKQSHWNAVDNRHGNEGLYVKNSHVHRCRDSQKIIVFYNTMWGQPLDYPKAELPPGYAITTDSRLLPEAVAIVFHMPSLRLASPLQKKPGQIWIAWSMECEANYSPLLSNKGFMKFFDLTMTYHLDADVPLPYVQYEFQEELRKPPQVKVPGKIVNAFISSSVDGSGREEYLREFMKHIEVHSYGKTMNNRVLSPDTGRQSKLDTLQHYMFTLAFENAIARDYVTEKFYDPLLAGSVPVYLGAPNIEDFAPGDHCFVNAADYPDPHALAAYLLAVSKDESAYQRFFSWKSKPFRPAFMRLLELQKEHAFVRLCRKVEERLGVSV